MPHYTYKLLDHWCIWQIKEQIYVFFNTLSKYMVEPKHVHLVATKHVMRYLKGTLDCGLIYAVDSEFRLYGWDDLDWEGSVEDRKIISGCCFSLGSGVISWLNKKQTSVSLSTAEVEYIAACPSCSEAIWLRKLLAGLFDAEIDTTDIYCDNQSCIKLTKNLMFNDKPNHLEINYHYIEDMVHRGAMKL